MEIQLRNPHTGRKIKCLAGFKHQHPAALVLQNGRTLDAQHWMKGKARVLHATSAERANLVGWLLQNLPDDQSS